MILACDIGNTFVNLALMDDDRIVKKAKINTKGISESVMKDFLTSFGESYKIDGIVVANVVKEMNDILHDALATFAVEPLFINAYMDVGYHIQEDRKSSIGADIVATTAGAYALYEDCLVVDTGTATTFQVVKGGEFKGCVIASGLYMGLQALYDFTSLLPKIKIEKPKSVLGMDTVQCMQSGSFYGHAGMIEGIVKRIKKELGEDTIKVVATGGAAKMINEVLEAPFDIIDNELIFKGLKSIYDKNKLQVKD